MRHAYEQDRPDGAKHKIAGEPEGKRFQGLSDEITETGYVCVQDIPPWELFKGRFWSKRRGKPSRNQS